MKINFLNIPIDAITMAETLQKVENAIALEKQIHHTAVNAGKIVLMQTDKELKKSVVEADIINADGQAVVWASKFLGSPLPERVAGIDLMNNLIELSYKMSYKCFFLGATQDIVEKVVGKFSRIYSSEIIGGFHHGYFNKADESKIAQLISEFGFPVVLALGMGYFIYFVWKFVTEELKPTLSKTNGNLIKLLDQIRMLDNDLIRLQQKVNTVLEYKETQEILQDAEEKKALEEKKKK